ncbi:hypothetical protein [Myceligenerans pegani]|uniref:Uncharacterized protein n=1 Tax=Myceligenerans pegani TaxID=2776917 RepID=A0ABR9N4I6_9MICO|nr:hypothetical protein [Myceligenerans sp. TRM 65318]MBE1878186.1 hypothetical protein [Myceligenerans sp. TRM 65318]MBE3020457.1 hypothetical protein [Myceligenerans sp. TRM 65318]
MRHTRRRTILLTAGVVVGLTTGTAAVAAAVSGPSPADETTALASETAEQEAAGADLSIEIDPAEAAELEAAMAAQSDLSDLTEDERAAELDESDGSDEPEYVETPIELGDPTPGATDDWQTTETAGVGYAVPADWTGSEAVGDGGSGHEWRSAELAGSNPFDDHWRILVQSPFVSQEMPDPAELNEIGYHASSIEIEGASEAVLVAAQGGVEGSAGHIDFEVYVRSASTGVVTRFMGELPPGEEGQFFLDNFVPTIQP